MVQDPKEFKNLNSGLINGKGLAQKTGDKQATDSIAIDHILGEKSEVGRLHLSNLKLTTRRRSLDIFASKTGMSVEDGRFNHFWLSSEK